MNGSENSSKADELIKYLDGAAFDFYYESYAEEEGLFPSASNYQDVKTTMKQKFEKVEHPEISIQMAVNASLDEADYLHSLSGIQSLYNKAGFDEKAEYGLLTKRCTWMQRWGLTSGIGIVLLYGRNGSESLGVVGLQCD